MRTHNVSTNLQLSRFHNGIKLCKPTTEKYLIKDILKLPMAIYFEDGEGTIQLANPINAETFCGFDSPGQAVGKKYFKYIKRDDVIKLRQNDNIVLKSNRNLIFEETIAQEEGLDLSTLSIKFPWYDEQNQVIGLFGCSILLGVNPLAESLNLISELNLLTPNKKIKNSIGREINHIYLSKRQLDCAKLLLQGLKIKEIAAILSLSPRTIETYVDNMKSKLKCQNRTDFIIKLYEYMNN